MNINQIKAGYLKANPRNYYKFRGLHINYSGARYYVTSLYNVMGFKTIKEVKAYIASGEYVISRAN